MTDHIVGSTRVVFDDAQQFGGFDSEPSVENKSCFPFVRRPARRIPEMGEIHFR